jgi:hypothetical protein
MSQIDHQEGVLVVGLNALVDLAEIVREEAEVLVVIAVEEVVALEDGITAEENPRAVTGDREDTVAELRLQVSK